ncbi:hypothetical protein BWQ93_03795 [Sphingopyxis sp. QXT-31]|uniref:hypothetical protein n=1 Tax=Sphingopyxis sp. QXT-31 TaxID=1357916 RepID=UPI0009790803|nr:hypothetical protein [Sphingopyxis sp. QXT-31]APZ97705.1 hypothetical protein BWQ93_03795 [Sphingopyxis sp. QXT-31]
MPQKFSWSFSGGTPSGAGANEGGSVEVDAITSAEVTLAKASADRALALQIDDVEKLAFFILTSSINDGSVGVKADTATRTKITGPLILYGEAIKLFAGDLQTLTLKNASATDAADITILMGFKLD